MKNTMESKANTMESKANTMESKVNTMKAKANENLTRFKEKSESTILQLNLVIQFLTERDSLNSKRVVSLIQNFIKAKRSQVKNMENVVTLVLENERKYKKEILEELKILDDELKFESEFYSILKNILIHC